MIGVTHAIADRMSASNRLLCKDMLARGWKVEVPYEGVSDFYIEKNDGQRIHFRSTVPPTVSYAAALTSNDKLATSFVLASHGIEQLPVGLFAGTDMASMGMFLDDHKLITAKPLDGSHGNGITTGIDTAKRLAIAVEQIMGIAGSKKSVLLQRQFKSAVMHDIRVLIINGHYIASIHRVAARVRGDGVLSVEALIERENQHPDRGEPYRAKLARIDEARAHAYLGEKLQDIPVEGEFVTVTGVANYGAGGELIDITDDIPEWMRAEAILAAETLDLKVAGVDFLVDGAPTINMQREHQPAIIIEVNSVPSLCIHDEPTRGKARGVVSAYVDYLADI